MTAGAGLVVVQPGGAGSRLFEHSVFPLWERCEQAAEVVRTPRRPTIGRTRSSDASNLLALSKEI